MLLACRISHHNASCLAQPQPGVAAVHDASIASCTSEKSTGLGVAQLCPDGEPERDVAVVTAGTLRDPPSSESVARFWQIKAASLERTAPMGEHNGRGRLPFFASAAELLRVPCVAEKPPSVRHAIALMETDLHGVLLFRSEVEGAQR